MTTPAPLPAPESPTSPVLVFGSIAAACTALITILAAVPQIPVWVPVAVGAVGTVATAVGGYLAKQRTVPLANVGARYITQTGEMVSGPASPIPDNTPVDVTAAGPSPYSEGMTPHGTL